MSRCKNCQHGNSYMEDFETWATDCTLEHCIYSCDKCKFLHIDIRSIHDGSYWCEKGNIYMLPTDTCDDWEQKPICQK